MFFSSSPYLQLHLHLHLHTYSRAHKYTHTYRDIHRTLTNHISIVRLHSDTYTEKEKRKKTESKAVLIAENQAKTGTEIDRQT